MAEKLYIGGRLARRIRDEAEKLGFSVEEYLVEVLSQGLDPKDRAQEYVGAAEDLLEEAREELEKGNIRQAAEKLWGAAALAVKAYAYWKEEKRLASHGELWEWKRRLEDELGEWVHDSWMSATGMHICFYEGWCSEKDVADAEKRIEKLVKEIASLLGKHSKGLD
ncbi:MAG: PaREP1 family protein [Desulfurococcales archaeon]|nr:PaREP1 family protein [Desulfurococcales archaeon]